MVPLRGGANTCSNNIHLDHKLMAQELADTFSAVQEGGFHSRNRDLVVDSNRVKQAPHLSSKMCNPSHAFAPKLCRNITKRMDSLPSPTSTPKPFLLQRRPSSTTALIAPYAGPAPAFKDGSPLKSCFRTFSCSHSTDTASLESVETSPVGKHCKVTFTHVTVREYCLECGDNPSVTAGPPLSLGWEYNKKGTIDIDSFEADKLCKIRGECRRLSAEERENLLVNVGGHSHRRVLSSQYDAHLAHQKRWETIDNLGGLGKARHIGPRERVAILKESAARKFERAYKGTSTAKEQRKLWESAQLSGQAITEDSTQFISRSSM
ncbi:hypothetical protein HJC23_003969 [Cyclotella cryptica]|uniref:Uncharacterized protein n=1 Tax=Cyclotella cryptica TaxID=29204 RepID=A0ABD3QU34_9STRA|eukprot:CCRYP_001936-RA/>CCRYP_001936-RA protein AED:0.05 eAED:0.05 QI:211/-1/1/1/-1/1/1/935/320